MTTGIVWKVPPSTLAVNIRKYQRDLETALAATCVYHGQKMQGSARRNAPWTDRTGNARSGLFFVFEASGMPTVYGEVTQQSANLNQRGAQFDTAADGTLVIWLSHTMYYGVYLELANGGKYAVILSTLLSHLPGLEASLKKLVG
jgi:hypothetical protein